MTNENNRIFDYFIVTGLPPILTTKSGEDSDQSIQKEQHRQFLLKNAEIDHSKDSSEKKDPIVEIAILNRTLNEGIPIGYECIWSTPSNNSANLCCEMYKKNEMYLLIKRGLDKPPIADIGVYYEGNETVREGCTVIKETIGNNSANLNTSSLNAKRVFITYRRLTDLACNCLAMVDVCLINKTKGEKAPHTFNEIQKNLNVGYFGPSMALCYKKSWIPAPQIKYTPSILYRYPQTDHLDLPFPGEMSYFGLPMGATIESWPIKNSQTKENVSLTNLKPVFSTFVLNVNSEDGTIVEKVYGSVITFYEDFDQNYLSEDQCEMLKFEKNNANKSLHSNKSLVILSRHPIFETYKSFLFFLFNKYTKKINLRPHDNLLIPIERYLSYLIFDVPFPTTQKPRVLVHLTDCDNDNLTVNLPSEIVLPQSGASFTDLLYNLKVENSINVFLFAILQRNLMVHSLRRCVLTSVVEAISSIIFPFMWRYSYLPMCPLSLSQLIDAPGSFIIGMDTRFFDYFELPQDVICVDLDTNTISWTQDRNKIKANILPKNIKANLSNKLEQILEGISEVYQKKYSLKEPTKSQEIENKKRLRQFELSIREAFLKAMASILYDYEKFLLTATRRPDLKAIDRNIVKYFDVEKFIGSKNFYERFFYQELVRTQLFYDCIMNLSFTSELDPTLAQSFTVFSDICSKMYPNSCNDEIKLISLNNSNDSQTIVMLPPQLDADFLNQLNPVLSNMDPNDIIINGSAFIYDDKEDSFPKLKTEVYSSYNSKTNSSSDLDTSISSKNEHLIIDDLRKNSRKFSDSNRIETQSNSSSINQNRKSNKTLNTPMGIRTRAEKIQILKRMESKINFKPTSNIKQAQKNYNSLAKFHAYFFLSNAYALWFIHFPEYIKNCDDLKKKALDQAYMILVQMQNQNIAHPDEVCYRIMMQLCFFYKFPLLAVRTFLHIKKYKLDISPITYSFYNKALTETDNWPTFDQDKWGKIRLIWLVVCKFRQNLRLKNQREQKINTNQSKSHKRKNKRPLKVSKMPIMTTTDNNKNQLADKKMSFKLNMKNLDKMPIEINPDNSRKKSLELFFLFSKTTGLLFSYIEQTDLLISQENLDKKYFSISHDLDKLNISVDFLNKQKLNGNTKIIDPLSALLIDSNKNKIESKSSTENEDVEKRLFGYKPFESKSDFIYDKNANSSNDQDVSYDSDQYSDDVYDESDEQDFYDEDESINFEENSDVEVDSAHFNLNSREGSDKLSQSKITLNSNNSSKTPEHKKNTGLSGLTPFFSGIAKKLENSLELSGSKLKTACQLVTDKSLEFKDALISTSNQNEFASTVRSFSAYNIKTKNYINNIVKSTSSFSIKKNFGLNESSNSKGDRSDKINSFEKMQELFNLEPLLTDEKYEAKSLEWWKIDRKLNHFYDPKANQRLLEVQMSTCNFCDTCNSYLYDEEIMSGWTLNDSNMNIKCIHCSSSIVPNIFIKIKDMENMKKLFENHGNKTNENIDPHDKIESHPFNTVETSRQNSNKQKFEYPLIIGTSEFTVQYLSPLVVRKELENIILNKNENLENEDVCLFDENFMINHEIIFWNLIWYYKRTGLDCSFLENILLNQRIKLIADIENFPLNGNYFDFKTIFPIISFADYHSHPHVRIYCMWDNLKMQNEKQMYEIPLYISWLRKNFKTFLNDSSTRLVSILKPDDLNYLRTSRINDPGLAKIFDLVLRNVKENEITDPLRNLLRERIIAKRNFNSIYREILFLIIVALERELIDIDAFDTEYKEAFKKLFNKDETIRKSLNLDQPPNHIAVWCRRLFSPLLI